MLLDLRNHAPLGQALPHSPPLASPSVQLSFHCLFIPPPSCVLHIASLVSFYRPSSISFMDEALFPISIQICPVRQFTPVMNPHADPSPRSTIPWVCIMAPCHPWVLFNCLCPFIPIPSMFPSRLLPHVSFLVCERVRARSSRASRPPLLCS